ncbi:hypothetical protein NXW89_00180 [Bacteroides thetaiotaomicron]|nr:hypothetical protein [Bacteroides thetaiotaomicron]
MGSGTFYCQITDLICDASYDELATPRAPYEEITGYHQSGNRLWQLGIWL